MTRDEARYATFEDEDHSWCVVTVPGGDYVAWPEMTQADADRLVAILNAPALYTFEHDHFAKIAAEMDATRPSGDEALRAAAERIVFGPNRPRSSVEVRGILRAALATPSSAPAHAEVEAGGHPREHRPRRCA